MNNLSLLTTLLTIILVSAQVPRCPVNQCEPECIPCRITCNDVNKRICPLVCVKPTQRRCYCKVGWLQNAYGTCIPEVLCPGFQCPENELVPRCARCNDLCTKRGVLCAQRCEPAEKCYCGVGYYRHQNGTCVSPSQCPRLVTP